MVMVCPECKTTSAHGLQCPDCNVPMRYQPARAEATNAGLVHAQWSQSPSGRIFLCLLLALGLCYGLFVVCQSSLAVVDENFAAALGDGLPGLALLTGLPALAVLAASILAGSGNRGGSACGAAVGMMSGLVLVAGLLSDLLTGLVQPFFSLSLTVSPPLRSIVFYGLPGLYTLCGAIGGLIGNRIWQPSPTVALSRAGTAAPKTQPGIVKAIVLPTPAEHRSRFPWAGPVSWLRVLAGTFVAVGGGVFTKRVIELIVEASEGYLHIATELQSRVSTGEIFSLSILIGGCVAGATTPNGIKQGLCVGVGAGLAMVCFFLTGTVSQSGTLIFPIFSTLCLGPIGGWFGTELMPPAGFMRPRRVRHR